MAYIIVFLTVGRIFKVYLGTFEVKKFEFENYLLIDINFLL